MTSTEPLAEEPSSEQGPTFRLFDRDRTEDHPWSCVFGTPSLSKEPPGRWAVAANWKMDHRVSPERESGDVEESGHFASMKDVEDWWASRHLYFEEEVRNPGQDGVSAFLRPTNEANRVRRKIARFDRLVHVGCLDSLVKWASRSEKAADAESGLRVLVGQGLGRRGHVEGLVHALVAGGEEVIREAVSILMESLAGEAGPWWACFAHEVQPWIDRADAAGICAALGLGHRRSGEWLVTWIYPVSEAGPLYRPTALEANASPFHFPSPPELDLGITMPLRSDLPASREVLHPALRFPATREYCTGRLLRLSAFPASEAYDALRGLRVRHRERLRRELSLGAVWMERNPELS